MLQAQVSAKRIKDYLLSSDVDLNAVDRNYFGGSKKKIYTSKLIKLIFHLITHFNSTKSVLKKEKLVTSLIREY